MQLSGQYLVESALKGEVAKDRGQADRVGHNWQGLEKTGIKKKKKEKKKKRKKEKGNEEREERNGLFGFGS